MKTKKIFITNSEIDKVLKGRKIYSSFYIRPDKKKLKNFIKQKNIFNHKTEKYLESKNYIYIKYILKFLKNFHSQKFNEKFIERIFSESFFKFLVIAYSNFIEFKNFNYNKNLAITFKNNDFFKIDTFSDFKKLILQNPYFKDKLFSIYLETQKLPFKKIKLKNKTNGEYENLNKLNFLFKIKKIIKEKLIFKFLKSKIFSYLIKAESKIIIYKSYFSLKNRLDLNLYSKNKIITIAGPSYKYNASEKEPLKSPKIKDFLKSKDHFDKFVIGILKEFFPRLYLEDFESNYQNIKNSLKKYEKAKFIINESFLDNDYDAFFLAIAKKEFNIKHIYIEHNILSYPFLGNRIRKISNYVDRMYSLGWKNNNFKKVLRGSSLYQFTTPKKRKKKYHIVYFSHASQVSDYSLRSVITGNNGLIYYNNMEKFFSNFDKNLIKKIYHKPYPVTKTYGVNYTLEDNCKKIFSHFKKINKYNNAENIISEANLCIIDHCSTTFLKSIISDTPTICLWHKDLFPLSHYGDKAIKDLLDNNLMFCDLRKAREFIYKINKNPYSWWFQKKTINARKNFINSNIGKSNFMINELLKISKS
jgi:putative transferase (TIGR04331 family)